jgi:hypothetical protein
VMSHSNRLIVIFKKLQMKKKKKIVLEITNYL